MALINVYVPTGNITKTNLYIKKEINKIIEQIRKEKINNIIIERDWNATINEKLDRWTNFAQTTNTKTFPAIKEISEKQKLHDV
jgi:ABC-type Zn uptake system ZnuABC Zn-binding protein ZnuA